MSSWRDIGAEARKPFNYQKALVDAFCYDTEIIIEQAIIGREIECSVLGNQRPRVALPGEIVCHDGFYSCAAKYVSEDQASVEVPADLTPVQVDLIQRTALKVYRALYCQGMARVDVFLTADDIIYINEVNTIPGFTSISMYAQNWLASGLDMSALLMKLIHCAVDVHQQRKQIQTRNLLPLSINKYEFS